MGGAHVLHVWPRQPPGGAGRLGQARPHALGSLWLGEQNSVLLYNRSGVQYGGRGGVHMAVLVCGQGRRRGRACQLFEALLFVAIAPRLRSLFGRGGA